MRRNQTLSPSRRLLPERGAIPHFSAVFVAVFVVLASLSYLTIALAENAAREQLIGGIEVAERQGVNAMRREARETLIDVTADLLVYRSLFRRELAAGGFSRATEQRLLDFMQNHRIYDQVRFIDAAGREQIRVDNERDGPRLIAAAELQDKSGSSYIAGARGLALDQILISQIEPNRERGQVELPLNPVIRVVTRVENSAGDAAGYVVLNYRARFLLRSIQSIGNASLGSPLVVNGRGGEAMVALDIDSAEALMAAQAAPTFALRHTEAWEAMNQNAQGVASDGGSGIMVFDRFLPAEANIPFIFAHEVSWTLPRDDDPSIEGGFFLVSHVDGESLAGITRLGLSRSAAVVVLFILIVTTLAWLVALRFSNLRSDTARMHELATRDDLTGLLTRGEFERRLDAALSHAQRHHRAMALLYIDLDRFKDINDTLGHGAGDQLLRQVAETLTAAVRTSDFVGRVGGDEFAVALTEIRGRSDTLAVAQKLRERLTTSVVLAGRQVDVGGSVGGATFPDDATTAEALFDTADRAMYENKSQRAAA